MAREFMLSVVAPDRSVVEEPVVSLMAPGLDGYFGMLAGHLPIISALRPGTIEYEKPTGERSYVVVGGGFLEMTGERATVLANSAERATEIDISKAQELLEQARSALRGENSAMTSEEAAEQIEVAMNRLRAAQKKTPS